MHQEVDPKVDGVSPDDTKKGSFYAKPSPPDAAEGRPGDYVTHPATAPPPPPPPGSAGSPFTPDGLGHRRSAVQTVRSPDEAAKAAMDAAAVAALNPPLPSDEELQALFDKVAAAAPPVGQPEAIPMPPPAVQRTHDDVQLYLQEGAGMAAAIELVKVQHAREIREALDNIAHFLGDIRGVLGEIADK